MYQMTQSETIIMRQKNKIVVQKWHKFGFLKINVPQKYF